MKEKKVLLAESNPDHAELIIDELKTEDIKKECILMKDGLEVIKYFQKEDANNDPSILCQIELIILNLDLPKVDGMEILRFIKETPKFSSIPLVVFLSTFDPARISDAYKYGADDFLTTPTSFEEFTENMKLLRKYISKTNGTSQLEGPGA